MLKSALGFLWWVWHGMHVNLPIVTPLPQKVEQVVKTKPKDKTGKHQKFASTFLVDRARLIGCTIGLDLLDGSRVIGEVFDWSVDTVWVFTKKFGKPIDIPKSIVKRMMVCLKSELDKDKEVIGE